MPNVSASLQPIDYTQADFAAACYARMRDIGFVVVENHAVDYGLICEAYAAWRCFFEKGDKDRFKFDAAMHDGYVDPDKSECAKGNTIKDLKAFYHYYSWGRCPTYLKTLTETLYQQLTDMANDLLAKVGSMLPKSVADQLTEPLQNMSQACERTLLRPIYYPAASGSEPVGAVRAAEHTDINLVTLIPSATAPGLEVKGQDGQWHAVPCDPRWMVVNVGDMLQECTAGHLKSTLHRVVNPEPEYVNKPRISMPLFLHARDNVKLSERYTARSYREERWGEIGLQKDDYVAAVKSDDLVEA